MAAEPKAAVTASNSLNFFFFFLAMVSPSRSSSWIFILKLKHLCKIPLPLPKTSTVSPCFSHGCAQLFAAAGLPWLGHVPLFATPRTVSRQAPLSMGFSRQESRSGLPFPTPGDRPSPGIEPESLASPASAGWFFTTAPVGKPRFSLSWIYWGVISI